MRHFDLTELSLEPHSPQILQSDRGEGRAIALALPAGEALPAREKRILLLRFFKNMTQSEIAEEIGVSQMHVSRLLSRTLEQLRTSLQESV